MSSSWDGASLSSCDSTSGVWRNLDLGKLDEWDLELAACLQSIAIFDKSILVGMIVEMNDEDMNAGNEENNEEKRRKGEVERGMEKVTTGEKGGKMIERGKEGVDTPNHTVDGSRGDAIDNCDNTIDEAGTGTDDGVSHEAEVFSDPNRTMDDADDNVDEATAASAGEKDRQILLTLKEGEANRNKVRTEEEAAKALGSEEDSVSEGAISSREENDSEDNDESEFDPEEETTPPRKKRRSCMLKKVVTPNVFEDTGKQSNHKKRPYVLRHDRNEKDKKNLVVEKKKRELKRTAAAQGLFANRDVTDLTSMMCTSPRLKQVLDVNLESWQPSFPLLYSIIKSSTADQQNLVEEAFRYCNIMCAEANISLQEHFEHMALTLSFIGKQRSIRLSFQRVWTRKKKDKVDANIIDLRFDRTRRKLMTVLAAAWSDKLASFENERGKKVKVPNYVLHMEKFAARGKKLCEILIASVVITEYCLSYTSGNHGTVEELFQVVMKLFRHQANFLGCWRLMEWLLRLKVGHDEETLRKIRMKPSNGETYVMDAIHGRGSKDPEDVRDWAIGIILGFRSRKGEIFYNGNVTEKDAALWTIRALIHVYKFPQFSTDEEGKYTVLSLRMPTKAEVGYETVRHNRLVAGKKYYLQIPEQSGVNEEEEAEEGDGDDEIVDIDAAVNEVTKLNFEFESDEEIDKEEDKQVEAEEDKEDEENNDNDDDEDDDDNNQEEEKEEEEEEEADGDDNGQSKQMNNGGDVEGIAEEIEEEVTNGRVERQSDKDDVDSVGEHQNKTTNKAAGEVNKITVDGDDTNESEEEVDQPQEHVDETGETILLRDTTLKPMVKWNRFATSKDLEGKSFVLDYLAPDRVKCSFELGKLDHIHFTRLEETPHLLSSRPKGGKKQKVETSGSRLFVERKDTHFLYDYGVVRCDDAIMKKHRASLVDIDFDLILRFLCAHGFKDKKRDNMATQTLRVSVGSANHNYEHRPAEKEKKGRKWHLLRDLPRNDCNYKLIANFNPDLPKEIGKLLDFGALVFDEKMKAIRTPIRGYLDDQFIYSVFTEPFVSLFSCKHCRYPSFDLVCMDAEEPDSEEEGMYHTDGNNGTNPGNDISSTLSIFFRSKKIAQILEEEGLRKEEAQQQAALLLKGKKDIARLKRLYIICYTRSAHEYFRDNETLAEGLKSQLKAYKTRLDDAYQVFGGSFESPQDMVFPDEVSGQNNTAKQLMGEETVDEIRMLCYKLPPCYAGEMYCSGGMTILYRANQILAGAGQSRKKMLELYIVALSMGSWFLFYHAGLDLLEELACNANKNLTVLMLETMVAKFGTWKGGPGHRGRPPSVDLVEYYSNEEHLKSAVDAMDIFLSQLETRRTMSIEMWRKYLRTMVQSLHGVGEHYGMRFGFYAGLTGLVSTNLQNCLFAYAIQEQGSSKTIEAEDERWQSELDDQLTIGSMGDSWKETYQRLKDMGLRGDPEGFHQTVRLVSSFCGLEGRPNWIENLFCDGIGPNKNKFDYIFPGQSLFWFNCLSTGRHKLGEMVFVVKTKAWGSQLWSEVKTFF